MRWIEHDIWRGDSPADFYPPTLTVHGIEPVDGVRGDVTEDGGFLPAYLTNVDDGVPEVLRAAWIVTRHVIAHHLRHRSSTSDRTIDQIREFTRRWDRAALPLAIRAGEDIGLAQHPEPIRRAAELWIGPEAAEGIETWWRGINADEPLPPQFR